MQETSIKTHDTQSHNLSHLGSSDQLMQLLVTQNRLRESDLARLTRIQDEQDVSDSLPSLAVKLGMVSEGYMAEGLAEILEIPLASSGDYPDIAPTENQVSLNFMKDNLAIPLSENDEKIDLAMAHPQDHFVTEAFSMAYQKTAKIWVGIPSEIEEAIERLYGGGKSQMSQIVDLVAAGQESTEEDIEHLKDQASEAPVIRLVNLVIQRAENAGASDIHFEPFENRLKVRYRIDGVLQETEAPPTHLASAVISRIKIMANLNIAERRLSQDGRMRMRIQGNELDIRVSTIPTMHGESVVLRLLNQDSVSLDFPALGFSMESQHRFMEALNLPNGMILVTGPTGSGKTTTLYAALDKLNTDASKMITVEDHVEYQLDGINQIQVKPSIGLTFASALRSIVRQDPDIIMVGEMRDLETARMCIQSSLTGHLVLSTLHTNDAASSITRLIEMGVEDYLLTSTLNAVIGQRLVRVLCPKCRESYAPLPETIKKMQLDQLAACEPITLYKAVGCSSCNETGFQGRTTIIELMIMTESIRQLVLQRADADTLLKAARENGMTTMREDGLKKALDGVTTVEEIFRVTFGD